jgi:Domain of unknown function (DUF6531)
MRKFASLAAFAILPCSLWVDHAQAGHWGAGTIFDPLDVQGDTIAEGFEASTLGLHHQFRGCSFSYIECGTAYYRPDGSLSQAKCTGYGLWCPPPVKPPPLTVDKVVGLYCDDGKEVATAGGCAPGPAPQCGVKRGNPVEVLTGEKIEMVTDYATAGPNPLEFKRIYRSNFRQLYPGPFGTMTRLGRNWRSEFDSFVGFKPGINPATPVNGNTLGVVTYLGDEIIFRYDGTLAKWQTVYMIPASVPTNPPTYSARTDLDMSLTPFPAAAPTELRLTYKNGDVYAYDMNGRLNQIRKAGGSTQTLT